MTFPADYLAELVVRQQLLLLVNGVQLRLDRLRRNPPAPGHPASYFGGCLSLLALVVDWGHLGQVQRALAAAESICRESEAGGCPATDPLWSVYCEVLTASPVRVRGAA